MAEKRKANDENSSQFINISGPPQKRLRRVAQTVTEASRAEARQQWEEKQREEAAARAELDAQRKREEEAEKRATSSFRIGQVLDAVKTAGYRTLHEFLADLLAAKDAHQSSQVSQTLINHGDELLDLIRRRQPDLVSQWVSRVAADILKVQSSHKFFGHHRAKESAPLWSPSRWLKSLLMRSTMRRLSACFFARSHERKLTRSQGSRSAAM